MENSIFISNCRSLLDAYNSGKLGNTKMPEDSHPIFTDTESRLAYFTLPMSLNYQRDSYKMWEAALATFQDSETKGVFNIKEAASMDFTLLQKMLLKHKLALQPNKHASTWQTIAKTVSSKFGSMEGLFNAAENDFIILRQLVQVTHKKGFPYLSGPKIFNYWSFIIQDYGGVKLANSEYISVAPDTHVIQASVKLGVITKEESSSLAREKIAQRWRDTLHGSGITPIQMHPPLWFWSRNNFIFQLDTKG